MRVVQFGISTARDPDKPSIHHPGHVDRRAVVYTGTKAVAAIIPLQDLLVLGSDVGS